MEIIGKLTTHRFENGTETLLKTEQYGGQEYTCQIASTGNELYRVLHKTAYGSDTGKLIISTWTGSDWQERFRQSATVQQPRVNGGQVVAVGNQLYIIHGPAAFDNKVYTYSAGTLEHQYDITGLGTECRFFSYNGQLHVSENPATTHTNLQISTLISSFDNSGNRNTLINTGTSKVIFDYSVTTEGIIYSSGTFTQGAMMYMQTDSLTDITLYENGTSTSLGIYLDSIGANEAANISMGMLGATKYYRFGFYFVYNDTIHYLGHAIPDGDNEWDDVNYKVFFAKYKE